MPSQPAKAEGFLALHRPGAPLLMPNPWGAGSAKVLAWQGFEALATNRGGFAVTLGRRDGSVGREAAIAHAARIVDATGLPISADFENAFADAPDGVAETVRFGIQAGLAGCSVEDYTGRNVAGP
jgi:2-methylisocitrate lyase-like PEP mutase family enzyme